MAVEETSKPGSAIKLGMWLGFAAFVLLIIVFRGNLSEISFGDKGVSAKMWNGAQDAGKLSPEERKTGEASLTERITNLEKQATAHPQPAPDVPTSGQLSDAALQQQPVRVNLTGQWNAPDGTVYQIAQYGNYVGIQGYYNGYRFAAATGQIWGQNMSLQSQSINGEMGMLYLQVAPDQAHLVGQYQSALTGQSYSVQLSR